MITKFYLFFAALTLAHLRRWAAAILARASADSLLRFGVELLEETEPSRARIAESIRARSVLSNPTTSLTFMATNCTASVREIRDEQENGRRMQRGVSVSMSTLRMMPCVDSESRSFFAMTSAGSRRAR